MDERAFRRPKKRVIRRPVCDVCGQVMISTTMLANHRSRHTPEEIANPQPAVTRHVDSATAAAVEALLKKRKKAIDDALGTTRNLGCVDSGSGNGPGGNVPIREDETK